MKFSVLIAHYNNAKFFTECMKHLQEQTYSNWEAIILDDSSNEEEKNAILQRIATDSRFKFFENEKNEGVGVTKSKLIELASGEICGFVDPDDAILPQAIEKSIDVFQKEQDVVLTYSRFMTCDEHLRPISTFKSAKQVQNGDPTFFNYPVQIAHFVTFRKSVYEKTEKMNSNLKIAEDQDLYLKLYEKGRVKFIDDTNYLYRTHSSGISQNENKKKSYEFWSEVIYNAMKRRKLKKINGQHIPERFPGSEEVFKLVAYQNTVKYRIWKNLKILLQK